jgi:Na+-transporting NADH:ubiquinone oxidoreductase subunit NqrE
MSKEQGLKDVIGELCDELMASRLAFTRFSDAVEMYNKLLASTPDYSTIMRDLTRELAIIRKIDLSVKTLTSTIIELSKTIDKLETIMNKLDDSVYRLGVKIGSIEEITKRQEAEMKTRNVLYRKILEKVEEEE